MWDRVRGLRRAGRSAVLTVVLRLSGRDLLTAVERIGRVKHIQWVLTRVIDAVRIGRHCLEEHTAKSALE